MRSQLAPVFAAQVEGAAAVGGGSQREGTDSWPATVLRMLVYGLVGFAGLLPVAVMPVAIAAGVGAGLGALLGRLPFWSRLRFWALPTAALPVLLVAFGLGQWLVADERVTSMLGPAAALRFSFALQAGLAACVIATLLRASTRRYRVFAALEVAAVALSGAGLVVAHRGGAINRPFELADAILAEGGDPTTAFLALGAAIVVLFLLLLLAEGRPARGVFHLLFVGLLFFLFSDQLRVPEPPPSPLLQSRGQKPGEGEGKHGQRGGGSGQPPENNEELQFRDNYDSEHQQVPLAVVLLHNDFSPPSGMYYFRQAAFSQFNGRRLVQTTRGQVDGDVASGYPVQATTLPPVPNALSDRQEVATTVALLSEHTRPFALESLQSLAPADNPDPGRFRRVYRTQSLSLITGLPELLDRGVGSKEWPADVQAHYLRHPDDPRYGDLAAEIASHLPQELQQDAVARALSVSLWLGKKGTYSLRSGHANATDPTADFLFGDLTGYCVHFAHAAVYLMRALGIPARVGAGYVVDESARQGGSAILITGQNAHAWPEFYVNGVGWVVADVAPERTLDPPPALPDPDLQRLLGEMARGLSPLPGDDASGLQPVVRAAQDLINAARAAILYGLPLVLIALYLLKLWRRLAPRFGPAPQLTRLHYRAQLDQLAELSLLRHYGESREAFARRLGVALPAFGSTTELHLAHAFGGGEAEPSRGQLRTLEQHFRGELRHLSPLWRRLLAYLDPISFLRVR